jgi:hypothetical protein
MSSQSTHASRPRFFKASSKRRRKSLSLRENEMKTSCGRGSCWSRALLALHWYSSVRTTFKFAGSRREGVRASWTGLTNLQSRILKYPYDQSRQFPPTFSCLNFIARSKDISQARLFPSGDFTMDCSHSLLSFDNRTSTRWTSR